MVFDTGPEARGVFLQTGFARDRHWRWAFACSPLIKSIAACLLLVAAITPASSAGLDRWTGGAKPSLELDSLDHGKIALTAYEGRAVLVHFFATWCEPCVAEMASLERLALRRRSEALSILAIDVGEIDARVRSFINKNPVSFPTLLDRDRAATKAWQVKALPSSFILDSNLVPVLFVERDVDWDDPAVNSALDEVIETLPRVNRQETEKGEALKNDKPT